jgi:hypothetical protein
MGINDGIAQHSSDTNTGAAREGPLRLVAARYLCDV